MNPRLIAVAGPLEGTIFPLGDQEISIGRKSFNAIALADDAVSRKHCAIRAEDGVFMLRDLDSRNGTYVNGIPVRERPLEHGDQIKAGASLLLFLCQDEAQASPSHPVRLEETSAFTGPYTRLRPEDSVYLHPDIVLKSLPDSRIARDLQALLKIGSAIHSIAGVHELSRQLLDFIFEAVPARRGAIFLALAGDANWEPIHSRDLNSGVENPVVVSRTVLQQVREEGAAILSSDAAWRDDLESAADAGVKSLLTVPLILQDRITGAIYLDTVLCENAFDNGHLELMTAIAGIAAPALDNARRVEWLEQENQRLNAEISVRHNMVGESARMRAIHQFIGRVASTESTVLITGESGTGKELVARAIHQNSRRSTRPFVAINCATLTEPLLESELFGHEKGAFTGAVVQKRGKLEMAEGGTVFLDELGELTPVLQAKLLRVLQEREFERLGGTRSIAVNIRLIAATNKNLEDEIAASRFRADLYYRLNVVAVEMPPLRERREDIGPLASYFTGRFADKCNRKVTGISPEARACLANYDWPGNVRELENAIERAVVLGAGGLIQPEDLPEALLESDSESDGAVIAKFHESVRQNKKQLILRAMDQAGGNYTDAAKALGLHPNYLHRLIRNLNLKAALKARAPG